MCSIFVGEAQKQNVNGAALCSAVARTPRSLSTVRLNDDAPLQHPKGSQVSEAHRQPTAAPGAPPGPGCRVSRDDHILANPHCPIVVIARGGRLAASNRLPPSSPSIPALSSGYSLPGFRL
ncbi:hypothetical protein AK830_g7823 [Neonectria ditissima]|uniref:Uncharacterized protein n=1 Tax=Neonectria ditissima TaxID=78410 RepID=A0A0P7BEB8_9HYPO|nr:hypothetical protein AK830_g7823 [Neonectria ditissima]